MLKIAASSSLLFGEPRIIFLMRLLSSGLRAWWQEVGVDSGRPAFRARLPPPGAARGGSGEGLAGEGGSPSLCSGNGTSSPVCLQDNPTPRAPLSLSRWVNRGPERIRDYARSRGAGESAPREGHWGTVTAGPAALPRPQARRGADADPGDGPRVRTSAEAQQGLRAGSGPRNGPAVSTPPELL